MIVGIYDDDLLKHPKSRCGLNLELMKISAYHKNKGDIVVLSPTYSPEKYSVFYYGKDMDFTEPIPNLLKDNVTAVGRYFYPKKYAPLPSYIEKMNPDTSLYQSVLDHETMRTRIVSLRASINGTHLRLSTDGKIINSELFNLLSDTKMNVLFIYDYDLFSVEDSIKFLKELADKNLKKTGKINFRFPVIVNNMHQIDELSSIPIAKKVNKIICNSLLPDNDIYALVTDLKYKPLLQIFSYNPVVQFESNDLIIQNFSSILKQGLFFRMNGLDFPLSYRAEKVIPEINDWLRLINQTCNKGRGSIYEYCLSLPENTIKTAVSTTFCKKDARILFKYMQDNNINFLKECYKYRTVEYTGGVFLGTQ